MPKLQRLRHLAYLAQQGRCCYCNLPMWLADPAELAHLGLRPSTLAPLKATAEHLQARRDGGKDEAGNIAAACWLCNVRRHARKKPRSPDLYRLLVQRRMARGKWHCPALHGFGLASLELGKINKETS